MNVYRARKRRPSRGTNARRIGLLAAVLAGITLMPAGSDGQTTQPTAIVWAATGSAADVNAALAGLDHGGVLVIPPGEWVWDAEDQVKITADDVTILGVGAEHTALQRSSSGTRIAFFHARGTERFRISGLTLRGVTDAENADKDIGVWISDGIDFRVDHCAFSHLGLAAVRTQGESHGVVDHCRFDRQYKPPIGNNGYGVAVFGTNKAEETAEFGTHRATFIENNTLSLCRHSVSSNKGARYVFRHNHVTANTKAHAIDTHGEEYAAAGSVGTEWAEVYGNVVEAPDVGNGNSPLKYAVRLRGGGGLIYDNTFRGVREGVRIDEFTPQHTGPVHVWDNTLEQDPNPRRPQAYCMKTRGRDDELCPRRAGRSKTKAPADGVPEFAEEAPAGYVPYPYPHPLVAQLGFHLMESFHGSPPEGALAPVGLRAVITTVDADRVTEIRWFRAGDDEVKTGDGVAYELPRGTTLFVAEVERDDGHKSHQAIAVQVPIGG